jgi:RND family efflux transporter MFP subunit
MRFDPRYFLPLAALTLGAAFAAIIIGSAQSPETTPERPPAPLVRTVTVELETFLHRVFTHGTVKPRTESDLTAEVAGRVIWISPNLVSGGYFEKDEALLRIDPHDYEVALERARANVTSSESQVKLTVKELARQRKLATSSVASEANLDAAVNAERTASAARRAARAELAQAVRDLARTEILAPYEGRVREETVDVGQWVNQGNPIARLYAVDYAEVRLPVPDRQLAFLDVPLSVARREESGDSPEVLLRAEFAGVPRVWIGRVVRTEGEIDAQTRMIHVVARVDDPYRRNTPEPASDGVPLAVGLFVEAEIVGREARDVVVLPRSALRDGDRVFVIDADERLRFRDVDLIRRQRDRVVIGAGLEPGAQVCISPIVAPVDGMRVRVAGRDRGP